MLVGSLEGYKKINYRVLYVTWSGTSFLEDQETNNYISFKHRNRVSLYGHYMLRDYMAEKHFERFEDKSHTANDFIL
jgi:hypothetical protein